MPRRKALRPAFVTVLFCAVVVAALPDASRAANITIVVGDGAGEGFNDATPRAPVFGNPGTTLGAQRLNVFQAAAAIWGQALKSTITIQVLSRFDPLFCDPGSAVLGSAGPTTAHRDFAGAPVASTYYVAATANSRAGSDLNGGTADINATFNSTLDLGGAGCLGGIVWSYVIGGAPPGGTVDLMTTVLHELAHGLGFLSLHDLGTGAKFLGFDDAYLRLLRDESTNKSWSAMTNAERLASQVNTGNLTWTGANANAATAAFSAGVNTGRMRMYAPNPVQPGSSVSHWDTALSPNELQEPILTSDAEDYITYFLLEDVGWLLNRIFKDGFEAGDKDFWSAAVP
jgi:hypothetical protein